VNFEVWRPIKGYRNFYEVSNKGNVKSIKRAISLSDGKTRKIQERILKPSISQDGYLRVILSKNSHDDSRTIHRLVAEAFIPNPDNLPEVNHKSGIKADNAVENLEWMSHQDNCIHAYETGLNKSAGANHFKSVSVVDNGIYYPTAKAWADAKKYCYSTVKGVIAGFRKSRKIDLSEVVFNKKNII
jgi:hypothetical protein